METDEGAAADRHRGRRAGHQVVVAAAVVGILVADRADDRELVKGLGQRRQRFAEVHARHARGDRLELAADFLGRVRLRIEGFVVRGTAVEPDQDAVDLVGAGFAARLRRLGAQCKQVGEGEPAEGAEAGLEEVAAAEAVAVGAKRGHDGGPPNYAPALRLLSARESPTVLDAPAPAPMMARAVPVASAIHAHRKPPHPHGHPR